MLEGNSGGIPTFTDLGNGSSYGSETLNLGPGSVLMPEFSITLNAAALADINAILSGVSPFKFGIGGALTSLSGQTQETEGLWGASSNTNNAATLSLEVSAIPLPAALPLLGGGLALLGLVRARRG